MESRKMRLGPSKFGVWYENQRASWQSERTLASWLSRHSGLSWNSGVLMKTSEGIFFSIAHLSPLKQLPCKPGQKLPWFADEKPPKQTKLPILSIASCSPLKAWTTKDKMQLWWSRVTSSWSWLVLRRSGRFCDTLKWQRFALKSSSHKLLTRFFRPDI